MNDTGDRERELYQTLVAEGFKRDRSVSSAHRFTGTLNAANRDISVAITFTDTEFTHLPTVELLAPEEEAPQVVAHLAARGTLCFARDNDHVLDRYDVGGTALLCLKMAHRGLERALTHQKLGAEIAQEFPQHWLGHRAYCDVKATQNTAARLYTIPREGAVCTLLSDSELTIGRFGFDASSRQQITNSSRPAYVFSCLNELTFNQGTRQPKTVGDFLDWLEEMLPGTRRRAVREMCGNFPHQLPAIFINAPNGCVGIVPNDKTPVLKAAQRKGGLEKIINSNAHQIEVSRISGTPADLPFIFGRNLHKHSSLGGKRIALIGCGTIGSHLAKFLLQSGAGHLDGTLTVLDNQTLAPGNIGRHYLGTPHIGTNKSEALKRTLDREFPEANILAMAGDAESLANNFDGYDLVIDATGEEALSMSINHHFVTQRSHRNTPDVVHVWLFGNGAAAQTLLVDGGRHACLKCLKPDHGGGWKFNPLKLRTVIDQTVAACGEAQYTPYGVAAPVIAAALALQLILDWVTGHPTPRLRTKRIEEKDTNQVKNKNQDKVTRCPCCSTASVKTNS